MSSLTFTAISPFPALGLAQMLDQSQFREERVSPPPTETPHERVVEPEADADQDQRPELSPSEIRRLVTEVAKQNHLDPRLLHALVYVESKYDPSIVHGRSGASGLLQLTSVTQKALGVTDPLDPRENLEAGAKYINQLLRMFKGNLDMALSAWIAGPTAVKQYGKVMPKTLPFVQSVSSRMNRGQAGAHKSGSLHLEAIDSLTLYHGTDLHNLPSILQQGLEARSPNGGWARRGVYMTQDFKTAAHYGAWYADRYGEGSKPIVLEVRVSKHSRVKKIDEDQLDLPANAWGDDDAISLDTQVAKTTFDELKACAEEVVRALHGTWNWSDFQYNLDRYHDSVKNIEGLNVYQYVTRWVLDILDAGQAGTWDAARRPQVMQLVRKYLAQHSLTYFDVTPTGTLRVNESVYGQAHQLVQDKSIKPSQIKAVWVQTSDFPELDPKSFTSVVRSSKKLTHPQTREALDIMTSVSHEILAKLNKLKRDNNLDLSGLWLGRELGSLQRSLRTLRWESDLQKASAFAQLMEDGKLTSAQMEEIQEFLEGLYDAAQDAYGDAAEYGASDWGRLPASLAGSLALGVGEKTAMDTNIRRALRIRALEAPGADLDEGEEYGPLEVPEPLAEWPGVPEHVVYDPTTNKLIDTTTGLALDQDQTRALHLNPKVPYEPDLNSPKSRSFWKDTWKPELTEEQQAQIDAEDKEEKDKYKAIAKRKELKKKIKGLEEKELAEGSLSKKDQNQKKKWEEALSALSDVGKKDDLLKDHAFTAPPDNSVELDDLDVLPNGGVENILKVLRAATGEEIEFYRNWYQHAHDIAAQLGEKYQVPTHVVAYIMAVISPNNKWDQNIVGAENILRGRGREVIEYRNKLLDHGKMDPKARIWPNLYEKKVTLGAFAYLDKIERAQRILDTWKAHGDFPESLGEDILIEWDPSDKRSMERAKKRFDMAVGKGGYDAFLAKTDIQENGKVKQTWRKGEVLEKFPWDNTLGSRRIILKPMFGSKSTAPKISAFFHGIADPVGASKEVVLDGHAINIWRGETVNLVSISVNDTERKEMIADYQQAAAQSGPILKSKGIRGRLSPQQVQAVTWSVWRQALSNQGLIKNDEEEESA